MVKRLFEIKVLVEVESSDEIDRLTDIFEKAICPYPLDGHSHPDHCPNRWFIIGTDLDAEEAAVWEELLND
jgi:hypothetical protein